MNRVTVYKIADMVASVTMLPIKLGMGIFAVLVIYDAWISHERAMELIDIFFKGIGEAGVWYEYGLTGAIWVSICAVAMGLSMLLGFTTQCKGCGHKLESHIGKSKSCFKKENKQRCICQQFSS